jgi:putative transposase
MGAQPPYQNVAAAYQLHYHLWSQTRRNHPIFTGDVAITLENAARAVCNHADYHLLGHQWQPTRLELLLSLKPTDAISQVVARIKANVAALMFAEHPELENLIGRRNLWAASYKVESVGKAATAAIKAYVDSQRAHHTITQQAPRKLSLYSAPDKQSYLSFRRAKHAVHLLNFHLVFSIKNGYRALDEAAAQYLLSLWLQICEVKEYTLLTLDILEDHTHAVIGLPPSISPQAAAETLMNNTSYLTLNRFPNLAEQFPGGQLWTPGFFVRSIGNRTTAQVKSYFASNPWRQP